MSLVIEDERELTPEVLHHLHVAVFQVKGNQQLAVGIGLEAVGIGKLLPESLVVVELTIHHRDNHSVRRTDRLVTTGHAND